MFTVILILHVLGATVWTGGHLVLATAVLPRALRERDPALIRDFESSYERIGLPALLIQVVTGLWLAHRLLPDVGAWFALDSYVATHIALKLALLGLTLVLAADSRLRLIPNLSAETLPALAWHIYLVTVIAVLFVMVGVGLRTGGLF